DDGPQPAGMFVGGDVEAAIGIAVGQQVHRGEVAGGVVEEHVFRARVARDDRAGFRRGVPLIDGGVVVHAGIGRGPRGIADRLPQVAGLDGLDYAAVLAGGEVPLAIILDGVQEVVGDADGIVRVLPGDGQV